MVEDITEIRREYGPFIRWWWPGLAVESEQIEKELEILKDAGFIGVEIQPFLIGGAGKAQLDHAHRMAPNPYYYKILEYLLNRASEKGMVVDLTFGSSWPPGSTSITLKNSLKTLLMGVKIFHGGEYVKETIPPIQKPPYFKYEKLITKATGVKNEKFKDLKKNFKAIALIAAKAGKHYSDKIKFIRPKPREILNGSLIDLTSKMHYDNDSNTFSFEYKFPGTSDEHWYVFSFYAGPMGMWPISPAKSEMSKKCLVLDILNKESVKILIDELIGLNTQFFKNIEPNLGKTLRALFTDSQEIACEWFWTTRFFDEFKRRRGYDVRIFLPALYVPNRDNQFLDTIFGNETPVFDIKDDRIGQRIRNDWLKVLSDLWIDEYIAYISEYCSQFRVKHRIQTYGMPIDLLQTFSAADIPETETLFSGSIDFFKIATSSAILTGKDEVSSETFSWMRKDLTLTPIKIKLACDRLFIAGINRIIFHGWTYGKQHQKKGDKKSIPMEIIKGYKENDFPGHYPWAGHGFSEDFTDLSPLWPYIKEINEYITHIQYLMRGGTIRTDVAIFMQMENYSYKHLSGEALEEGTLEGYDDGPIGGPIPWFMRRIRTNLDRKTFKQQQIGKQLSEFGFWYAHINEDFLNEVQINREYFTIGKGKFKALILNDIIFISLENLKKIKNMINAGIPVIFIGGLPRFEKYFKDYKKKDEEIDGIMKDLRNLIKKESNVFFIDKKHSKKIHLGKFLKEKVGLQPIINFNKDISNIYYILRDYDNHSVILWVNLNDKEITFKSSLNYGDSQTEQNRNDTSKNRYVEIFEYDCINNHIYPVCFRKDCGGISDSEALTLEYKITLQPYESKIHIITRSKSLGNSLKMNAQFRDKNVAKDRRIIYEFKADKVWDLEVHHREMNGRIVKINVPSFKLKDLSKVKSLRYKSGPFIYSKNIKFSFFPDSSHPDKRNSLIRFEKAESKPKKSYIIEIDLGKVHGVAQISINNRFNKSILFPPYKVEYSPEESEFSENLINLDIGIKIISTIQNLLVGYAKKDPEGWPHYRKRNLMPAGLLGPVKFKIIEKNK